ncbi:MAG: isochorismate synthase [Egibacteraceae bacterium]
MKTWTLAVRTVEVGDPGDLVTRLPDTAGFAWVRRGQGLVAWGEAARVEVGAGEDRFARAASALTGLLDRAEVDDAVGLPGTGPVAFGSFTFDPDCEGSVLVVPRMVLGRRGGRAWLTTVGGGGRDEVGPVQALPAPGRIRYAGASFSEVRWMEAVDAAVRAIRRGELAKVVLARDVRVWSEQRLDPRALVHRLAERFPQCFAFACAGLVGATPELLVRRLGDLVESVPLAGSAARGPNRAEDARLGEALMASEKNRGEHQLAVDSVKRVLGPLCVCLDVDPQPWLLRLGNVQHLATALRGRLARPLGSLDLAGALHPTAAVCGAPTAMALDCIRALEGMDRGRYAGPVGWTDARGDGEWGIALRCAEVDGPRARLFAGAGLVAASLPEAELEETRLKLLAMQSALCDHGAIHPKGTSPF